MVFLISPHVREKHVLQYAGHKSAPENPHDSQGPEQHERGVTVYLGTTRAISKPVLATRFPHLDKI
jgi:hypothetical protein